MKISVITVTFNALAGLRQTISSVIRQTGTDFEFIVVDGASKDGTQEYLEHEATGIDKWVSEPDHGIYEAMNKGVRLACGDYCIFMNAGDRFISHRVLERVSKFLGKADIILGNAVHVDEKNAVVGYTPSHNAYSLKNLLTSSTCHQATFIRRSLLLEHPYDESLRLVSDWKFIVERYLEGLCTFKEINVDVCYFQRGGATDTYQETGRAERNSVLIRFPEYEGVWSQPYSPSLFYKFFNKSREICAHLRYCRLLERR